MKKLLCLSSVIFLLLCSACSEPKPGKETGDDPERYLEVNEYVAEYLKTELKGSLPAADQIDVENAEYMYRYECGILGDPSFMIYLNNRYSQAEAYTAEESRLQDISVQIFSVEGQTLYVMHFSEDAIERYSDGEILDGAYFVFEAAVADNDSQTIRYLSALQWDNNPKYDAITDFVALYEKAVSSNTPLTLFVESWDADL